MNKKRFIGGVLAVIVILSVIQTPAILFPVLGCGGIIILGAGLCALLKWKDRLDKEGKIDYGKIPDWAIIVVIVIIVIVVILFISQ